jgi:CBS domain-containing protein
MTISELMTHDVATCRRDDSLARAAQIMWERDVGCIPVVDERNAVVGVLTDRDVTMACLFQGRPPADIPVADTMTRALVWCTPRETVRAVEHRMAEHRVRRMLVVDDDGCLVGLVSLADLARDFARGGGVGDGGVAGLLADVGAPRACADRTARAPMPEARVVVPPAPAARRGAPPVHAH